MCSACDREAAEVPGTVPILIDVVSHALPAQDDVTEDIGAIYQPTLPLPSVCANGCAPAPVCTACSACFGCCTCSTCQTCGARVAEVCSRCDRCEECCACETCGCGAVVEALCENCEECAGCCPANPPTTHCHTCAGCSERQTEVCPRCDSCSECCTHVTCGGCDRLRDSEDMCENCHECTNQCCSCSTCGNCDEMASSVCDDCDRCDGCGCNCGDDDANEEGECGYGGNARPPWRSPPSSPVFHRSRTFKRNPLRRFLSCELEVASIFGTFELRAAVDAWNGTAVVRDGSLPDTGFEINTPPTNGDAFVEGIERLSVALKQHDAKVTTACGYHVHVDARDLSYANVQTLIKLYARIEPALFRLVPPSRRNNHYAAACGDRYLRMGLASAVSAKAKLPPAAARKEAFERRMYGIDESSSAAYAKAVIDSHKGERYHGARYAALNLHSWLYRGTIECRLAAGTTDVRKIIHWAMLWGNIVEWCRKHADIDVLPADAWECVSALAPTEDTRTWLAERKATFGYR